LYIKLYLFSQGIVNEGNVLLADCMRLTAGVNNQQILSRTEKKWKISTSVRVHLPCRITSLDSSVAS